MNQNGLARRELCGIKKRLPCRQSSERDRRGMNVVDSFRLESDFRFLHGNVFGVGAIAGNVRAAVNFVAHLKARDAGTGRFDDARKVPAGNERHFVLQSVLRVARAHFPIDGIYARRVHADQNFARPILRARRIFVPKHLWPAVFVDSHRFHRGHDFLLSLRNEFRIGAVDDTQERGFPKAIRIGRRCLAGEAGAQYGRC